jgi:CubicO group peptidase (beta-lactamase class C family)
MRILVTIVVVVAVVIAGVVLYLASIARSGTGYEAQTLCSAVFISGRDPKSLDESEFRGLNPLLRLVTNRVDRARLEVTSTFLGLGSQKSVFRPGLGCTLADLDADLPPAPSALTTPRTEALDAIDEGVSPLSPRAEARSLEAAVNRAFDETDPKDPLHTRALLVIYKGKTIAERYAPGITKDMPLAGYSMAKSIIGALTGILIERKLLSLKQPAPVPLWRTPGDPRGAITIEHLLGMTTGLQWSEDNGDPRSDVLLMAYHSRDIAEFAASKPLAAQPGSQFAYSSGTTNILSHVLLTAMHNDRSAYLSLPRTAIFDPAGMTSALMPPDASGTLFGSTEAYATARDWARLGEIYLHDGERNGIQIFPKGWVAYAGMPQSASQARGYGAHIWVNKGTPGQPDTRPFPSLPEDLMRIEGAFGQVIVVIPSKDLIIVRLGDTRHWTSARLVDLVSSVIGAIQAK